LGVQDFITTPFYLIIFIVGAYLIRPYVTTPETSKYFMSGLLVKFIGSISLGMIYQFYYGGGDTFTFHTHGSRWIWQAFMDDPRVGLELFFQEAGDYNGKTFEYTSRIWMFRDKASMFIIKIIAIFDLFTFQTYSATALFFAAFAFSGHWALFSVFSRLYTHNTKYLAIAILFVPSVVFWGSGILKDTITLSALCWMTYALIEMTVRNKVSLFNIWILVFMGWVILSIKIYILLCFFAAASVFLYRQYLSRLKNPIIKVGTAPVLIALFLGGGYFAVEKIAEEDSRYALDQIGKTAMITAYDIRYGWGARNGDNSGYTLGELDGTIGSLIKIAPQGVVVTLFRPWLWEVKNPLMLLAAIESLIVLLMTLTILIKGKRLLYSIKSPLILFCLIFSITFAFAVGVSTFNFGTLMRYKIPVMPFYLIFLSSTNVLNRPIKASK